MKILVIAGGVMKGILSRETVLQTVKNAIEKQFVGHEIVVVMPEQAIASFLTDRPDRVIFLGISRQDTDGLPAKDTDGCILVRKIIIRSLGGDTRKYVLVNPLRLRYDAENFFRLDEMDKWPGWLFP